MNLDGMKRDCREAIRKHRGDGYAEMCLRVIDQCQAYQQQLDDTKTQLEKAEEPAPAARSSSGGKKKG
jgi:hypothetical protein